MSFSIHKEILGAKRYRMYIVYFLWALAAALLFFKKALDDLIIFGVPMVYWFIAASLFFFGWDMKQGQI